MVYYDLATMNGKCMLTARVVLVCLVLSACAEVKDAGKSLGDTVVNVTRDIGHGTRDAAKSLTKGAKRVYKESTEEDKSVAPVTEGSATK